jgi:hypothetical protein
MSGPHYLDSGDVISSALSMEALPDAGTDLYSSFRLEMGQIEKIYTIDEAANTSKDAVATVTVYDVVIRRHNGALERIPRCRMLQPTFGGGLNNFLEVLPTDPGFDGRDTLKDKALKRGHYVLVGFISGRKDTPVILGSMPHIHPTAQAKRPKKVKGTYTEGEIQGLNFSVDNDGALKVTFNGPRKDDGALVNANGPTTINIDKDGNVKLSTNAEQSVVIDRTTGHITVTNGPTQVIMDKGADQIDIKANKINTGDGDLQRQVVGEDWLKIMKELVTEIMAIYVPTGVGPSGNPINNQKFAAIKAKLEDALSKHHYIEK